MLLDSITLRVDICDQRRGYLVIFEGPKAEDMALAFIASRDNNHVFSEVRDQPLFPALCPRLADVLYPTCPHGLSLDLCEGPQHYGYDEDERRAYGC